jgi:hypothetical protein
MSLTQHFKKLGAPLRNSRWSWGSVRPSDGAIFLRVWQDQKIRLNGKSYMLVTHHAAYVGNESSPGYRERLGHIDLAREGRTIFMVICIAKDPDAVPRTIGSFIEDDVFLGGEIVDHEGDRWIEQAGRVDRFSIGL